MCNCCEQMCTSLSLPLPFCFFAGEGECLLRFFLMCNVNLLFILENATDIEL